MFKKTYESITASLRQLVQDLHDHADDHEAKAQDHQAEADRHLTAKAAAQDEADRARSTAHKVGDLLA